MLKRLNNLYLKLADWYQRAFPKPGPPARAHLVIRGYIYDAGYHVFVERLAQKKGLKGVMYVREAMTASPFIEIEVEGDKLKLEDFITTIRTGPRGARVDRVSLEWLLYDRPRHHSFRRVQ